jgi:hypothetical protein
MVFDSLFKEVTQAILIVVPITGEAQGTTGITLDNVVFLSVGSAIIDTAGKVWLAGSVGKIDTWTLGNTYFGQNYAGKHPVKIKRYPWQKL